MLHYFMFFFSSAPAGTARDGAAEGSVGEGKPAQDGAAAARSGTRGRQRAEKNRLFGVVWAVLTPGWILPARSSFAGLQGGGSRCPPGGRASSSPQVSASPASCVRAARCWGGSQVGSYFDKGILRNTLRNAAS